MNIKYIFTIWRFSDFFFSDFLIFSCSRIYHVFTGWMKVKKFLNNSTTFYYASVEEYIWMLILNSRAWIIFSKTLIFLCLPYNSCSSFLWIFLKHLTFKLAVVLGNSIFKHFKWNRSVLYDIQYVYKVHSTSIIKCSSIIIFSFLKSLYHLLIFY